MKHMNSSSCNAAKVICLGLARTIYIRCIYGIFGREITKFTVIYGAYIRSWPTLEMSLYHSALYLCFSAVSPSSYFLGPPPTASHNAYGKELLLSWHLDTFDLGTYVHHRHFCIVKNYYAEAIAFSHYRVCFVKSRGEKKDGLYVPKHSPFSHYRVCFVKAGARRRMACMCQSIRHFHITVFVLSKAGARRRMACMCQSIRHFRITVFVLSKAGARRRMVCMCQSIRHFRITVFVLSKAGARRRMACICREWTSEQKSPYWLREREALSRRWVWV